MAPAPASIKGSIARLMVILFGIFAIIWGASVLPQALHDAPLERTAERVIAGEPFGLESLTGLIPAIQEVERRELARPAALRSATILRLRLVEEAMKSGDRFTIDDHLEALENVTRKALNYMPSDSFLWLVLFWSEGARNGFDPRQIEYLRMSYQVGPNEGWVAAKRNHLALTIFEHLPSDLAERALDEFAALVNSFFYRDAADILMGPGWALRDKLLPRLQSLPERHRVNFSKALSHAGYPLDLIGAERPAPRRPWRD